MTGRPPLTVYVDLDGVILDVSEKMFRVYWELITLRGGNPLSREDYWRMKRAKRPVAEILQKSSCRADPVDYILERNKMLERDEICLAYDRLIPGARQGLEFLSRRVRLVLVTLRKRPSTLDLELSHFGIKDVFMLLLYPNEKAENNSKVALIRGDPALAESAAIVIGDTEEDISAGKELGLKTVAVTSGLRSEEFLAPLDPDFLVPSLADVPGLFREGRLP